MVATIQPRSTHINGHWLQVIFVDIEGLLASIVIDGRATDRGVQTGIQIDRGLRIWIIAQPQIHIIGHRKVSIADVVNNKDVATAARHIHNIVELLLCVTKHGYIAYMANNLQMLRIAVDFGGICGLVIGANNEWCGGRLEDIHGCVFIMTAQFHVAQLTGIGNVARQNRCLIVGSGQEHKVVQHNISIGLGGEVVTSRIENHGRWLIALWAGDGDKFWFVCRTQEHLDAAFGKIYKMGIYTGSTGMLTFDQPPADSRIV